jgi:imidazolonepropionase-like amidohydrolase
MHADYFKYTLDNFIAGEQPGKELPPGVMMAIGIRTCRVLLESGFTGYVGAACTNDVDAQLKIAIKEDLVPGPRILACGHHIGTTADNNDSRKWWQKFQTPGLDLFADGPIALRALVRDEIRRGVEVIKIFASSGHAVPGDRGRRNMARDEIAAVVEAAHDRGAKVRAHVCHKDLILEAIELGVDIIDHGDEVDEECVAAMVAANSFWVPSLKFLQIGIDQGWADTSGSIAYAHNNIRRILPVAQAAGVRILIGDDYGGDPLRHEVGIYGAELELYARIDGLTPADVLGWATCNAGQLLAGEAEKLGVVEPGALADLIVVNGIPTDNIAMFAAPAESLKILMRDGNIIIDRLQ